VTTKLPRPFHLALSTELAHLLGLLRDRALLLPVALLLGALLLTAQLPLSYAIEVGQEDGVGGDLPLLDAFNTAERDSLGTFRWSAGESSIRLPGIGARPVLLTLRTASVNDEMALRGPQSFDLLANQQLLGSAPLRPRGGRYLLLVPPTNTGDLELLIRSATHTPSGDVRALGVNLDWARVQLGWGAIPPLGGAVAWLGAALLAWLAMRRAGMRTPWAARALLILVGLVGLASALDPPRLAFGAQPALVALALACGLTILLSGWGGAQLRRWRIPIAPDDWRALCLLAALVFALRYGGKIYPDSMPGDIGFHVNRFADLLRGSVLLLSKNRGVEFPYPTALYLTLAPLTLLLDRMVLLQLGAALLDALSPILVFLIATQSGLVRDTRFAIAAGALYGLCGAGFMPTWWNFSTHIYAQFTHLALVAALVLVWRGPPRAPHAALVAIIVLQLLVYLGHFGFWINTTLLLGAAGLLLGWRAWRGHQSLRPPLALLGGLALAQLVALLIFYSAYTGLVADQVARVAAGGLNELAGRAPVPPEILWRTLRDGLYQHIGLFPIPLALCGLLATRGDQPTRSLMAITFVIAGGFAALPFLTGSTLATRWLMFSIWAICAGAAMCAERLWRRGRAARALVLVIALFVLWGSAALWLGALAWRVRPLEPF
jgi:hypothetical protein